MLEPVGFIAGFNDVALMGDAVEHGSRHLGIGKDLHPEMDPMGGTGTGRRLLSVNSSRFFHFRIVCGVTLYCLARSTCLRSR